MGKKAKTRRKSNIPRKLNNKHVREAVKTREERMYARMLKEKEKEKEEGKKKIQIVDVVDARNSAPPPMNTESEYQTLFSPLNSSIPVGMTPFTESLKDTYDRVVPFYENEIKKNLSANKNILLSAHCNSLRALCKYLLNISDIEINELEIPTGNPLIIDFNDQMEINKYYYLDKARAKNIIFNR